MSVEDLERRVGRLEQGQESLEGNLNALNTTIALLNQTVVTMGKNEEKRQQIFDRSLLFVIGGFISAVIAWVVRGGLGQ